MEEESDNTKILHTFQGCPICWSCLIEPVTLPCKHSVCLDCFKKHIQEAALCCPCCRERISIWSRRAMKSNNLVNQKFWERLKKELPLFVQARLDGQDSQDVLASLNFDCNETTNFNDSDCATSVIDGEMTAAGEIKKEFESMHKQHLEDLENRRKREAQASAEFIRKLKEEEQGMRLLAASQQPSSANVVVVESEEASVSASKPRQSRKLARNLLSEWSGTDLPSIFEKSDCSTNETQSIDEAIPCEKITLNSLKKGESSSSLKTAISVKPIYPLHKFNILRKVVEVPQQPSTSSSRSKESTSSFVVVHGPQAPQSETSPSTAGQEEDPGPRTTVKFSFHQIKENFPKSSSTPDSINIELNSHFRPIRTAPKTPPKRLPDGSYLPEPRIVKSTPLRPRSISEDDSPQPGLRIDRIDKLIRTADSEMNNGFVSSVTSVSAASDDSESSPTQPISVDEPTRDESDDIDGPPTDEQQQDDDSQSAVDSNTSVSSPPSNNEGEETSAEKAEREYYLMQALQLEQFRLKKIQEDEDRRYAEMIHKTINKEHTLARSRESADRYSIRNWVSRDRQVDPLNPSALTETHSRSRKRTALALCTSVNDATSSASGNSLRRSTRISTAMKSTQNSVQSVSKRGRPRKNLS